MKWLSLLTEQVAKLPLERLFVRAPDNKKALKDLQEILSESHAEPAETSPENPPEEIPEEAEEGNLEPRRQKVHLPSREGGLSTEETVVYQNREIGKLLLRMERHYAQRLRVNGIPCDCGSQKHLLDLESLCEETIPMVDNSDVYYRIIEWTGEVAPKSTDEAAKSGKYDNEYPAFSRQARDFRKEIIGSLEPSALFTKKPGEPEGTRILPVVSEQERKQIREKAHQKIEQVLSPMEAERVPAVIPTEPRPRRETDLEYLADSPEHLAQAIDATGYRDKLDTTFQEAIARAKGLR